MKPIITTDEAIIIPYETAIALYQSGYLDPALLGCFLPIPIAAKHCPQVLLDMYEIDRVASNFGKQ